MPLFGYKQTPEHRARLSRAISRAQLGKKRGALKGYTWKRERHCEICAKAFAVKFPCTPKRTCSTNCKGKLISRSQLGRPRFTFALAI